MGKAIALKNLKSALNPLAIDYDEDEDILILFFGKPRHSVGYDITDKIVAHVDPETEELISIEIFDFGKDLQAKTPADLPKDLVSTKESD